jgi:hypothetical protein
MGLLFPKWWAGIDVFYGRNLCDFCTPDERFVRHVELAIPVYVLLLYLPKVLTLAVKRRRVQKTNNARGI